MLASIISRSAGLAATRPATWATSSWARRSVRRQTTESSPPPEEADTAGEAAASVSDPLSSPDYFGVHKLFTVKDLFDARVHLGHVARAVDPRMRDFVFGRRFETAIIDLDQTALHLRQALNFLAHIAYRNGIVLFVCRQPQFTHMVERCAVESGEYAHCRKWKDTVFTAPHKEFGGEIRLPDCVVLLHTKDGIKYGEHQAIADSAKIGIPTVAVVDTDCNPNLISYPVPGNDDTVESAQLYLHLFKQAILLGKKCREEHRRQQSSK